MLQPISLTGQNFLSYETLSIDFRKGLTRIEGINYDKNGADANQTGKSSIFCLFCWTVFGQTLRKIQAGEVVNNRKSEHGESREALGEFNFKSNKSDYLIRRSRKTGKHSTTQVSVFENGVDITLSEKPQEQIDRLLGVDFKTFQILGVFSQYSNLKFISMTNREQKDVIESVIKFDRFDEYRQRCKDKLKLLYEKITNEQGSLSTTRSEKQRLENELEHINEKVDGSDAAKKLKKYVKELHQLELDHAIINTQLEENAAVESKWGRKRREIEAQMLSVTKRIQKIEKLHDTCPTCEQNIDNKIKAKILKDCSVELRYLGLKQVEYHDKEKKYYSTGEVLQTQLDEHEEKIAELKPKISALEERNKWIEDADKRKEYIEGEIKQCQQSEQISIQEIEKLKYKAKHYDFLEKAWSPDGIESLLFDTLLPFLNERGNHYLKKLSDGRLSLAFATLKQNKSGSFKDSFNVQIEVFEGGKSYGACSGSEEKFGDIAVQLALRDLCKAVGRDVPPILFLDEVFDSIDDTGCARLLPFLCEEVPGSMFLISHKPALKQNSDHVLRVTKKKGISKVKYE